MILNAIKISTSPVPWASRKQLQSRSDEVEETKQLLAGRRHEKSCKVARKMMFCAKNSTRDDAFSLKPRAFKAFCKVDGICRTVTKTAVFFFLFL